LYPEYVNLKRHTLSLVLEKSASKLVSEPSNLLSSPSGAAPIISILDGHRETVEKVKFCYLLFQKTLNALQNNQYNAFDAHTTTNCCHGIAILARELILSAQNENLKMLSQKATEKLESLDDSWKIPISIVELSHLFMLNHILEIDPKRGARSNYTKLNEITNIGYKFFERICKKLQREYSNRVALSWQIQAKQVEHLEVSGASTKIWGKYVSAPYLKISRGTYYAACLYSSQISLAYLSHKRSLIAIVNDIYNENNSLTKRYVQLLSGDGKGSFHEIESEKLTDQKILKEPVIVFGGCAFTQTPDSVSLQMQEWSKKFPELMLSGEIHYPQFPKVANDPEFSSDPIIPEEPVLKSIIEKHKDIQGVTINDPSFYLSNHIFPCSLEQIISKNNVPSYPELTLLLKNRKKLTASQ
jgi:hypothetical protein